MIDAKRLLADLQGRQKALEQDLRAQLAELPALRQTLEADYRAAREAERTAETFASWCEGQITQAAVAWLLAGVFLRFCEDNRLIPAPLLAGPGERNRQARDTARDYFATHPTEHERHYLEHCFRELARYPAAADLYDPTHNPLFRLPLSYDAARALVEFWQRVDPDTGALGHDFTDPALNTRFLGDLYQDLSEAARKRYALLQTPEFVEDFILARTLEPAIETFGLDTVRMIDPTCGSGHFLLGGFQRLLAHWERSAPGLDVRERVMRAVAAVHGVDINPFAVAIARFRLLVAALTATGIGTLKEAPGWHFNVTAGDSLLHGRRFGELDLGGDLLDEQFGHCYAAEDRAKIERILGRQYHAVVGNPPYITVKDRALNALYRTRYSTCHMKYSLGVPFTERFFQLAVSDADRSAGYVGLITTNSFMKREFGKKLIEDYLPQQDLTHVIDTSGAYIPGHGTPTVILFARHRRPVAGTLRAVLGIRGEPSTPADPARGLVWSSITTFVDQPGRQNEFVSVADVEREKFAKHPWSLQGGAAPDVMQQIHAIAQSKLADHVTDIGFGSILGEDDAFMLASTKSDLRRKADCRILPLVEGDIARDWSVEPVTEVLFPYDEDIELLGESNILRSFWPLRILLWARNDFSGTTYREAGRAYWSYHQIPVGRNRIALSITFAFVATHNHFVLDRGGKVFNRSAPVIKLPADADEDTHLGLLGLLNSSTACFWMQQVFHNKGGPGGGSSKDEKWNDFYEHDGTKIKRLPLPAERPLQIAHTLDQLARQRAAILPAALAERLPLSREALDAARDHADSLLRRMIAWQEELDWWCYRAYGLSEDQLTGSTPPPELQLGERAFEIVLARRQAAGELRTSWFQRHGSTPITELPDHWPADYRALVERRIALIESSARVGLLERPEYKRRWNQPRWAELEQAALKQWLLDRLETPRYWPEPLLRGAAELVADAERDAEFMAVARLYTAQAGFDVGALVGALLDDATVPALKVLRYKDSGLRKRADWERTWESQRREDAGEAVGDIPVPPKYTRADFANSTYWRLRGALDVPRERFFGLPDGDPAGGWLYGWAGWNPAQRVQAMFGAYNDAATRKGWPVTQLVPLLAAIAEELPWVLQWHNELDPEYGVRLGDFFREQLSRDLHAQGLTRDDLANWRPVVGRGRRRAR